MAKEVTREQAASKKAEATSLMERTGQPDRAQEFRSMSLEQYAEHRGLRLTNPGARRRFMPAESKTELTDRLDEISDLIDAALDAELSREEVIGKIKEMRDVVESKEDEEDEGLDADDDSDEDDSDED